MSLAKYTIFMCILVSGTIQLARSDPAIKDQEDSLEYLESLVDMCNKLPTTLADNNGEPTWDGQSNEFTTNTPTQDSFDDQSTYNPREECLKKVVNKI